MIWQQELCEYEECIGMENCWAFKRVDNLLQIEFG